MFLAKINDSKPISANVSAGSSASLIIICSDYPATSVNSEIDILINILLCH